MYPELELTNNQIQNLNKLYALYNQVNNVVGQWEDQVWSELESKMLTEWDDQITRFSEQCMRLPKSLKEWPAYRDLKLKIENYKQVLPYIKELREPMIKDRHWEQLVSFTKKRLNFKQPDNFFIKELIEANLMLYEEDLEDLIDSAKKQDKIERTKNEIRFDWSS